ncbi:MAG: metalloprotease TldD [Proteobacteria bacterium]|nr:metalloprotease TldD [Pseudomonadota bacterium]
MNPFLKTEELFFRKTGLNEDRIKRLTADALKGMDDGELFFESTASESFAFDDGRLKLANHDTAQGFGLRAVAGEATGLAHATSLDEESIKRAAATVAAVKGNFEGKLAIDPIRTNRQIYDGDNPINSMPSEKKIALLQEIDAYARAKDARVSQVSISLAASWQAVRILRPSGEVYADIRPLTRLNISVIMKEGVRQESGWAGGGGREVYARFVTPDTWKNLVNTAFKMAEVNLRSVEAPAGEMTVVLGPGWPGVLLHEAIGHGLEGDFNRKKTSVFSSLMGQRVAAEGVTIIDDGSIDKRRGSLTIDDEGTPTQCTVLIEDGILVGLMQDRLNARLMGTQSTGNGRRQSFACKTMPRMTNTTMLSGQYDPKEIIASVKNGIYAAQFGGGQVDITSGKFVFSAREAYKIEDGKITVPIKGATLTGSGFEALKHITMVGNDSALDGGIGTCGKDGQSVPVGVGQPTMKLEHMTVGGAGG